MNVLENILEEIGEIKQKYRDELILEVSQRNIDEIRNRVSELKNAEQIIRSHMGDLLDVDAEEKSILCTIGEDGMLLFGKLNAAFSVRLKQVFCDV